MNDFARPFRGADPSDAKRIAMHLPLEDQMSLQRTVVEYRERGAADLARAMDWTEEVAAAVLVART